MNARRPTRRAAVAASGLLLAAFACTASEKAEDAAMSSAPASAPVFGARAPAPPRAPGGELRGTEPPVAEVAVADSASVAPFAASGGARGAAAQATASQFGAETPSGIPAMLVRTGHASLEVDSLDAALATIRSGARRVGGYVAATQMSAGADTDRREATIQLRVPSARFDEVVAGLSPLGKVEGLTVETQDVGEEYADIEARMANARKLEQRLIDLLANRTGKLADVLTVEREIARVREDIERMEGRLRYLSNRASFSSLTLAVHEPLPVLAQRPHGTRLGAAVREAWNNFIDLVAALIAMMGVLIPLAAVIGVVAWAGHRWLPRRTPPSSEAKAA